MSTGLVSIINFNKHYAEIIYGYFKFSLLQCFLIKKKKNCTEILLFYYH